MTKRQRIVAMLEECQVPLRAKEIAKLLGHEASSHIGGDLAHLVRTKQIRKVSKGVYEPADRRTVGELAEIEVRRDVKPVVPDAPKVELKPCQNNRTVSLLLEVIARSDDPKPYAGVVREIGDLLATS